MFTNRETKSLHYHLLQIIVGKTVSTSSHHEHLFAVAACHHSSAWWRVPFVG